MKKYKAIDEVKRHIFNVVNKIDEGLEERGFKSLYTALRYPVLWVPKEEVTEYRNIEADIKLNFNIENRENNRISNIFSLDINVYYNGKEIETKLYLELEDDNFVRDFDSNINDLIEFVIDKDRCRPHIEYKEY